MAAAHSRVPPMVLLSIAQRTRNRLILQQFAAGVEHAKRRMNYVSSKRQAQCIPVVCCGLIRRRDRREDLVRFIPMVKVQMSLLFKGRLRKAWLFQLLLQPLSAIKALQEEITRFGAMTLID